MFLLLSTINIRAHIYYIGIRMPPNNEKKQIALPMAFSLSVKWSKNECALATL